MKGSIWRRRAIVSTIMVGLVGCGGGDSGSVPPTGGGVTPSPSPSPSPTVAINVVYSGQGSDGITRLYGSDSATGSETVLTPGFASGSQVVDPAISPDGKMVAFIGSPGTGVSNALYVLPIGGGTIRKVSQDAGAGRNVSDFEWSPDSQLIAYSGNFEFPDPYAKTREVFLVRPDGSARTKISAFLGSAPTVESRRPRWSPDGKLVLFEVANTSPPDGAGVFNTYRYDIYDVVAGARRELLKYPKGELRNPVWAPNSSKICYAAREDAATGYRLQYSNTSSGSSGEFLITPNSHFYTSCAWASDSSRVAYAEQIESLSPGVLKVRSLTTGAIVTVANFSAVDEKLGPFAFRPGNDDEIAFIAKYTGTGGATAWLGRTDKTDFQSIGTIVTSPQDALDLKWSPDGRYLAYRRDFNNDGRNQLFVGRVADPVDSYVLSSPSRNYFDYRFIPGSNRVIYFSGVSKDQIIQFAAADAPPGQGGVVFSPVSVRRFFGFDVVAPEDQ